MTKALNQVKVLSLAILAGVVSLIPSATHAAQSYNFSSSTAEAAALGTSLVSTAFVIAFAAIAAFLALAVALMGAGYVWGKFQKFTGMKKKI